VLHDQTNETVRDHPCTRNTYSLDRCICHGEIPSEKS
jgi:hypothetical protein